MIAVSQLGYVGIGARDVMAWESLAVDVLGHEVVSGGDSGRLYLRMDDYHHRIIVEETTTDDVAYLGWQVANASAMEEIAARLEGLGVNVFRATSTERRARCVLDLVAFDDPHTGIKTEIYYGPEIVFNPPYIPRRLISGFKAGALGVGHTAVYVPEVTEAVAFYRDVLGLAVSDWVFAKAEGFVAAFMHCNRRHHSLALIAGSSGRRIHHLMLEMQSIDDVGMLHDLCRQRGLVTAGLGRHANDQMFSFYLRVPGGWHCELGWGAREIDPASWQEEHYSPEISNGEWGHEGFSKIS